MTIVNTSGWDTDCNSGNVGCLIGVMHGLKGLEGGPDWRGPLADRTLISASDGGYAVNDAARIAYDIANLGRELAGLAAAAAAQGRARNSISLCLAACRASWQSSTPYKATCFPSSRARSRVDQRWLCASRALRADDRRRR